MAEPPEPSELTVERLVAPGTTLREAVELIMRQDTGALIVLGGRAAVDGICTGGFELVDASFTPQRLAELAKMDGAIVVDDQVEYILKANVHLIPDPTLETRETGTRHRTAERVARQTGLAVITVSEGRGSATVYISDTKYELQSPTALLAQANQSIQSLDRFRIRLEEAEAALTRAEVEDMATYRDVVLPMQRAALVKRVGSDVQRYAIALGQEGELIRLQLTDLLEGVDHAAALIFDDYAGGAHEGMSVLSLLDEIPTDQLYDPVRVAGALGIGPLDGPAQPRGYRALARIPRLPDPVKDALVEHFGSFQKMLHASVGDFDQVEGVGRARAHLLRHYFDQLLDVSPVWGIAEE